MRAAAGNLDDGSRRRGLKLIVDATRLRLPLWKRRLPPELALEREEAVPEAEVAADAAALSKAMYAEAVTCLKVVGGPPSTCTSYVYMCMCLCCAYCDIHEHTCRYISLSVCVS